MEDTRQGEKRPLRAQDAFHASLLSATPKHRFFPAQTPLLGSPQPRNSRQRTKRSRRSCSCSFPFCNSRLQVCARTRLTLLCPAPSSAWRPGGQGSGRLLCSPCAACACGASSLHADPNQRTDAAFLSRNSTTLCASTRTKRITFAPRAACSKSRPRGAAPRCGQACLRRRSTSFFRQPRSSQGKPRAGGYRESPRAATAWPVALTPQPLAPARVPSPSGKMSLRRCLHK